MNFGKYNVATNFYTALFTLGTRVAKENPTLAAGDVQISKDGGAYANLATLPDPEPNSSDNIRIQLSATELQCKIAIIRFKDQTNPAEWDEQRLKVYTYGNASAHMVFDLGTATVAPTAGSITDASFAAATVGKALRTGTATGGAAGYIDLDSGSPLVTDRYIGCSIKITSGTGEGQSRTIIKFDPVSQRAYVDKAWNSSPSTDSVFVIDAGKWPDEISEVGIATGGSASTITLSASASSYDDFFNGDQVTLVSGTGYWQSRIITDYNGTTKVATVKPDWNSSPASGSVYKIVPVGNVYANVNMLRGDETSAENFKLQFDGTGLTGGTYPATQAQVSAIGSGTGAALNFAAGEDNASSPIKSVSSVGAQTGTYVNTAADDGSTHIIASAANAIDWVYGFDVGSAKSASKVTWKGILSGSVGNSDTFTFQAYRFDTSAWETRYAIANTSGATQTFDITLLGRNTGTSGADKGKVYIRVVFSEADAGQITTDLLLVQAQQSGSLVGYSDGAVWLNTNASNTNTVPYIDGVADNPVSTIAAAMTLLSALNMRRVRVTNGSTVTLTATTNSLSFIGRNWTLALGGQDIAGSYFEGAEVSGTGTGATQPEFVDCHMNAGVTTPPAKYLRCGFAGTSGSPFVLGSAGEILVVDGFSEVAGSGTPYFTLSGASGINFRRWSGGSNITLNNSSATVTMEVVTGGGQTIACAGASVEIRGICRAVTLTGIASTTTAQIDAVTGPISLAGADGTVNIYGVCAAVTDSRTGTPALTNKALSQDTVPDVVWDEARSGHTSAGTFGEYVNANVTSLSVTSFDANLVSIDGELTSGNNATLKLKKLDIQTDAGNAVYIRTTQSGQDAVSVLGGGEAGAGIRIQGGLGLAIESSVYSAISLQGAEHGVYIFGLGGSGIYSKGSVNGISALVDAETGTGCGILAYGNNGQGIRAIGSSNNGISAEGNGSDKCGLYITGENGAKIVGSASDKYGILVQGGIGAEVQGLYSDAVRINAMSGGEGSGVSINGYGSGYGVQISAGATGIGCNISGIIGANIEGTTSDGARMTGGGDSGSGLNVTGHTNGTGFLVTGGTYGKGARFYGRGGEQGIKVEVEANAHAMGLYGAVAGSGLYVQGGSSDGNGITAEGQGNGSGMSLAKGAGGTGKDLAFVTPDCTIPVVTSANVNSIATSTDAATKLAESAKTMRVGIVSNSFFIPTATEFEADIADAATSYWVDRWVIFTSGALIRQAKPIRAYSQYSGKGHFTCQAFTAAPSSDDTFIIV